MPKRPILDRTVFYDTLNDGTLRTLDFCLVNTSLGAMVESRSIAAVPSNGKVTQVDAVDASFNRITQMDENDFYKLTGVNGRQLLQDFNY